MNPFRCSNCDKLLGMIEGKAEIKCYKCKTVNLGITTKAWMEEHASTYAVGMRIPCTSDGIIRLDTRVGTVKLPDIYTVLEDATDKLTPWKNDAYAGDIQIEVIAPITLRTSFDHEHVTRLTRKEIEDKYGK